MAPRGRPVQGGAGVAPSEKGSSSIKTSLQKRHRVAEWEQNKMKCSSWVTGNSLQETKGFPELLSRTRNQMHRGHEARGCPAPTRCPVKGCVCHRHTCHTSWAHVSSCLRRPAKPLTSVCSADEPLDHEQRGAAVGRLVGTRRANPMPPKGPDSHTSVRECVCMGSGRGQG